MIQFTDVPSSAPMYQKHSSTRVEFFDADGTLQTLEGPVRYQAGDALLTGVKGEQWPVSRTTFLETYQSSARPGFWNKKTAVQAIRVNEPFSTLIQTPSGTQRLHGKSGDWLVKNINGSLAIVDDAIFALTYKACGS